MKLSLITIFVAFSALLIGCNDDSITGAVDDTSQPLYQTTASSWYGSEGCTPGYWKNHLDAWLVYAPEDDFDTVFGVNIFDPDITLYDAVWARGGQENKLARHATAALLSWHHTGVRYSYNHNQILQYVQDWVDGIDNTDLLVAANEGGCPLN